MPGNCIVDSSALVALLDPREEHHLWAKETLLRRPRPWLTCESALSEALFLLRPADVFILDAMLRRGFVQISFDLPNELSHVLNLRAKYASVPMSLADACLVRMSEVLADPVVVTTDADFRIYRRHSRQTVPCLIP